MQLQTIEFIYFDGMGVLLEVNKPISHYFAQELGITPERFHEYEAQTIQTAGTEMNERFWNLSTLEEEIEYCQEFNRLWLKTAGIEANDQLIEKLTQYRVKPDVKLKPGVAEGLEKLSRKYRMGVLTNAMPSRKYYELTIDGVDQYLDPIIISRETGFHKPAPEIYQIAIEKSKVDPANILFVDDQTRYLEAALAAGIGQVVLMSSKEKTDKFPTISQFTELVDLLIQKG